MKKFYIKERHNPQLGTYYVACGQMTKKEAKSYEDTRYGTNVMHGYDTAEEYEKALADLRARKHEVESC